MADCESAPDREVEGGGSEVGGVGGEGEGKGGEKVGGGERWGERG